VARYNRLTAPTSAAVAPARSAGQLGRSSAARACACGSSHRALIDLALVRRPSTAAANSPPPRPRPAPADPAKLDNAHYHHPKV